MKKKIFLFLDKLGTDKSWIIIKAIYFSVIIFLLIIRRIDIIIYIIGLSFLMNVILQGIISHFSVKWCAEYMFGFLSVTFFFWVGYIYSRLYKITFMEFISLSLRQWWVLVLLIVLGITFRYIIFALETVLKYIKSLFESKKVVKTVMAFLSAYILIIVVFALIYASIFVRQPNSFEVITPVGIMDFVYFSAAQAIASGYKQISPASSLAKFLSLTEIFFFVSTVTLFFGNIVRCKND